MIRFSRKWADLATASALIAAVVFFFIETFSLAASPMRGYPGAAFLPRLILIYLSIFLAIQFVTVMLKPRLPAGDPDGEVEFELVDYLVTIAAITWFILALGMVGFEPAVFVMIAALLVRRIGKPVLSIASAALATLVLWAVFVIALNVSLPMAFLPRFISF
ncbi:tripartite tricarboxylate transporter TctB family protein [Pelagibacterium montanilacus]|uniref:tripartite tricarboxylate transporter TctB family protein n=1 Tax=Pelagibacterium montanilacus TaxID=2185280 RepID=UPI0013DECC63|nr:tripartite tricarboxylate transporter TctB family protein [Pelagibacterium montanilacus]